MRRKLLLGGLLLFTWVQAHADDYADYRLQQMQNHALPKLTQQQIDETRSWILYKDRDVIVINKPVGIAVDHSQKKLSVEDRTAALQFDAPAPPLPVHRLDEPTSGALVLARTPEAFKTLVIDFEHHNTLQKIYWALLNCKPNPESGTVDKPLVREGVMVGSEHHSVVHVAKPGEHGLSAVTHYRTIQQAENGMTWVELKLDTGRTHQIRVHMASLGCPVVGDHKYGPALSGKDRALGIPNDLQLVARRIIIPPLHDGGKTIDVVAPLPPHMQKSFAVLKLDQNKSN